jgi:hypothetical protein
LTLDPPVDPCLELLVGPRLAGVLQQCRHQGVHLGGGQPGTGEPRVRQAGPAQRRLERGVQHPVVTGMHRVQRDPHQGRLDDGAVGEGLVQLRGLEPGHPVPQRDVRRRRVLRLDRDDAVNRLRHGQPLAVQQELPGQRRAVQLTGGEAHARIVPPPAAARVRMPRPPARLRGTSPADPGAQRLARRATAGRLARRATAGRLAHRAARKRVAGARARAPVSGLVCPRVSTPRRPTTSGGDGGLRVVRSDDDRGST